MLLIEVPEKEYFDEATLSFTKLPALTISLEHSLLAISKWESIYRKPFLSKTEKSPKELFDYILMMRLDEGLEKDLYRLTQEDFQTINTYLNTKATATTFSEIGGRGGSGEVITSELIYYWLTAYQIPFSPTENWHLDRLMALVKICSIKNSPPKKMTKSQILARNRSLNEQRLAQYGTNG